jgi:hypothetical protein
MEVIGQLLSLAVLFLGEEPLVSVEYEPGWAPEPDLILRAISFICFPFCAIIQFLQCAFDG